jgi:predicted Zn-dependent protease
LKFFFIPFQNPVDLNILDKTSVDLEKKIETALQLEAEARGLNKRIQHIRTAGFDESFYDIEIRNHLNKQIKTTASSFGLNLLCIGTAGDVSEMGYDSQYERHFHKLNLKNVAREAVSLQRFFYANPHAAEVSEQGRCTPAWLCWRG